MNSMTQAILLRGLVAAGILGALSCGIATAGTAVMGEETQGMIVRYEDLNLASPQGAAALYHRIVSAAHQVCELPDGGSLSSRSRERNCFHKALTDAVTKVGQPQLTAVYNQQNRQSVPVTLAAIQPH